MNDEENIYTDWLSDYEISTLLVDQYTEYFNIMLYFLV